VIEQFEANSKETKREELTAKLLDLSFCIPVVKTCTVHVSAENEGEKVPMGKELLPNHLK